MDNSIDAHLATIERADRQKAVWVSWSKQSVGEQERSIEVTDNADGMTLEQMRNAVRAGYSNNNPIDNLGLFGMGFNIATARLGERTEIWSTTESDESWHGIVIDFRELARGNTFQAPLLERKKEIGDEPGTKIVITALNSGIAASLYQQESDIRKTLENIYAPLLMENSIDLYVQGKILHAKKPCVWSADRFVLYRGMQVKAFYEIDKVLGSELFDLERNAYLSPNEQDEYSGVPNEELPDHLCYREKRLHGWIGVQRYFDTNDYGIDFVRNGRKILIKDKSLFTWENPVTGESSLQYPVELGTTVGGRIVGQLHVDYLIPTYQKNDFDRYDSSWYETVSILRGSGPFLPRQRKNLGLDEIPDTPLGLLVDAYRRTESGTKNLAVPKHLAKEYLREFNAGAVEYQSDGLWWKAAQEVDQEKQSGNNPPNNEGDEPSDDIDGYLGDDESEKRSVVSDLRTGAVESGATESEIDDTIDGLKKRSEYQVLMSRKYEIAGRNAFEVRAYKLVGGDILRKGKKAPCLFCSRGVQCDFVYDPHHELFLQYPISPEELLFCYLADRYRVRDSLSDLGETYYALILKYMKDKRIDSLALTERAEAFFDSLREPLKNLLLNDRDKAIECIYEASGEVEEAVTTAVNAGVDYSRIKKGSPTALELIEVVPYKTLVRLIERFPKWVFDGQLFDYSYNDIVFEDKQLEERVKAGVSDRVVSYLKDVLFLLTNPTSSITKNDLNRIALSLESLGEKTTSK